MSPALASQWQHGGLDGAIMLVPIAAVVFEPNDFEVLAWRSEGNYLFGQVALERSGRGAGRQGKHKKQRYLFHLVFSSNR